MINISVDLTGTQLCETKNKLKLKKQFDLAFPQLPVIAIFQSDREKRFKATE